MITAALAHAIIGLADNDGIRSSQSGRGEGQALAAGSKPVEATIRPQGGWRIPSIPLGTEEPGGVTRRMATHQGHIDGVRPSDPVHDGQRGAVCSGLDGIKARTNQEIIGQEQRRDTRHTQVSHPRGHLVVIDVIDPQGARPGHAAVAGDIRGRLNVVHLTWSIVHWTSAQGGGGVARSAPAREEVRAAGVIVGGVTDA